MGDFCGGRSLGCCRGRRRQLGGFGENSVEEIGRRMPAASHRSLGPLCSTSQPSVDRERGSGTPLRKDSVEVAGLAPRSGGQGASGGMHPQGGVAEGRWGAQTWALFRWRVQRARANRMCACAYDVDDPSTRGTCRHPRPHAVRLRIQIYHRTLPTTSLGRQTPRWIELSAPFES